ncbi:threonine synthase [Leuconostoc sp. MS02]|uniref:Threonine synthase n=1 Tax=Leuconostoc aquikimchii TaxID=3236804 RepID=A0ABV3S4M4_9LACO
MKYVSTRGQAPTVTASQAILNGIAPDGGLYVPEKWPEITLDWSALKTQTYADLATLIFDAFFDDFSVSEIDCIIEKAYGKQWQRDNVVSFHKENNLTYLELFHGPTLAFKDVALQALPHLMTAAAKKQATSDKIIILTATSGDTGTAAMSGFGDVPQTEIVVFYPEEGVSAIQKQQMQTESADNAHVVAITGNFDDAQKAVKTLLADDNLAQDLKAKGLKFSSANSINIGRLVPQIVYYIYAYAQMIKAGEIQAGDDINVVVPTGNFGNVLAAYYASQIGLPVKQFVVASNENNVLTDFFETGIYNRKRDFKVTNAPAMDILVSSNLERLLYFASGQNGDEIQTYMTELLEKGEYVVNADTRANLSKFVAKFATQTQVSDTIKKIADTTNYTIDPHTAVGRYVYEQTGVTGPTLIAATASPYKFAETVLQAFNMATDSGQAALNRLSEVTGTDIPVQIATLFNQPIRHKKLIDSKEILATLQHEIF